MWNTESQVEGGIRGKGRCVRERDGEMEGVKEGERKGGREESPFERVVWCSSGMLETTIIRLIDQLMGSQ